MSSSMNNNTRPDKKTLVLGTRPSRHVWPLILGALGLALVVGVLVWKISGASPSKVISLSAAQTPPLPVGTSGAAGPEVTLSAAELADGRAHHYQLEAPDGKIVRYFAVRDAAGQIRTALDACEVCWPAGLGYAQDGLDMVCRNCGRHFPIKEVGLFHGGCNPVPLNGRLSGDQVILNRADILAGLKYFDKSK